MEDDFEPWSDALAFGEVTPVIDYPEMIRPPKTPSCGPLVFNIAVQYCTDMLHWLDLSPGLSQLVPSPLGIMQPIETDFQRHASGMALGYSRICLLWALFGDSQQATFLLLELMNCQRVVMNEQRWDVRSPTLWRDERVAKHQVIRLVGNSTVARG
jgi:hypothetical protein